MSHRKRAAILVLGLSIAFWCPQLNQASGQVQVEEMVIGEKITLRSDVLGEERRVVVRLPDGYRSTDRRYPVLYLMDGEFFFQQAIAAVEFLSECAYIDFAIMNHPVPEMIVVGVINVDRNRDFTPTHAPVQGQSRFPTSGGAESFLAFLEGELIPLIDSRYRTQPYRVLSGWSLGGLFTVHTFLSRPEVFSAYLAISPSLWWDNQLILGRADSLLTAGSVPSRPLVVTLGSQEGSGMTGPVRDGFISMFAAAADRPAVSYVEVPGEGHRYVPYKAIFEGLRALFSDWVLPNELLGGGLEAVEGFYERLSMRWGYRVEIPQSAYLRLASALNRQGDADGALEISRLATQRHPRSSWAHYRLGRQLHRMNDLGSARESYETALSLEKAYLEPDSERLLTIELQLQALERELNVR